MTATVELGLGLDRPVGEVKGVSLGMAPWRLLAESTLQAVNKVLPDGWKATVDDVSIIRTPANNLVTVTVCLGRIEETSDRYAGCALANDDDVGSAVVRATLQATNRRLGQLLQPTDLGRAHS